MANAEEKKSHARQTAELARQGAPPQSMGLNLGTVRKNSATPNPDQEMSDRGAPVQKQNS